MKYPPFVLADGGDSGSFRIAFCALEDLDWFRGHFPGRGILPGVALVGFVLRCAWEFLGRGPGEGPYELVRCKFQRMISPGTRLLLELRSPPGEGILDFAVTGEADGLDYASGRIRW